jgi:hypothetical protein
MSSQELRELVRDGYLITKWYQGPMTGPNFKTAESSFIFASNHKGKSRLAVRLALKFRRVCDAQVMDAFGAENDSESAVWLLCPETRDKTLIVTGNEVQVEGWDLKMPVGEFTLDKVADYDVIVTDRAFFGPLDDKKWDYRYYAALSRLFELAKRREGQRRLLTLVIREAWNVIYSQIKAGISRNEQDAMMEFRKMHNQRYHANVAAIIDTQRYTDMAASVRTLCDYRYIKGFGSQPIPDELDFLFKPHLFGKQSRRDWMMRNTPIDEFIMLTKDNGVAGGWYADIPWHIEKGFSPLKKLGITVSLKMKGEDDRAKNDEWQDATYIPTNNDQHRRMRELHDQGFSYKDVAAKMTAEGIEMGWEKVRYHLQGKCACEQTAKQPIEQRGT